MILYPKIYNCTICRERGGGDEGAYKYKYSTAYKSQLDQLSEVLNKLFFWHHMKSSKYEGKSALEVPNRLRSFLFSIVFICSHS